MLGTYVVHIIMNSSSISLSPRRQESHRVYLQQIISQPDHVTQITIKSGQQHHETSVNTTSAAVRLTLSARTEDVTNLLRQKFGLPPLAVQNKMKNSDEKGSLSQSGSASKLDKIAAVLERQRSSEKRIKKRPHDPLKYDTIVIVASCFLPKGFIRFEHERPIAPIASNINMSDDMNYAAHLHLNQGSEAFNLFQTLSPDDNPLIVKDELYQRIQKIQEETLAVYGSWQATSPENESIASSKPNSSNARSPPRRFRKPPVIRLFFMPCHNSGVSNATIDIEGYCTDVEDDSEDCQESNANLQKGMVEQEPNTKQRKQPSWKDEVTSTYIKNNNENMLRALQLSNEQKRLMKERNLLATLSALEASSGNDCITGYLLKQSKRDENVWKRVHCVLPNAQQFWYVYRVKNEYLYDLLLLNDDEYGNRSSSMPSSNGNNIMATRSVGTHGVIYLNGTYLIEAMDSNSPVSGIPNTFQMITKDGEIHTFRASSRNAYLKWMDCISKSIVQCQENSFLEHAEEMVKKSLSVVC